MLALGQGNTLSAASTITPTHDVHHVSGNTTIDTIATPSPDFCGLLILIPDDFPLSVSDNGNIFLENGGTVGLITGCLNFFLWDQSISKWVPDHP